MRVLFHALTGQILFREPLPESLQRSSAFVTFFALAVFCLSGCAGVNVVMLSTESFTPQTSNVEILEREPSRPYVQIALLTVDSLWLSLESKREKIVEKARTLGADAVIFGDLHLRPRNEGKPTDPEKPSSPSSPPAKYDKPAPDDLQSSYQDLNVDADVSVVLVRGGRGGGRGPAPRPWNRRPWGGYYAPYYGPGGYGFRPGWWGYGPYWADPHWGGPPSYWGGYYNYAPYPGYGAYSEYPYGYTSSVTAGTAIHYTK
jgi:hypothetical protein